MTTSHWYQGAGERREIDGPLALPTSSTDRHTNPAGYLASKGLVEAVNVALYLGQPLLLTGQPGTGKTQLAYSLAWELGLEAPLKFETKSTSVSRDLFYTYDALGRFNAGQSGGESGNAIDYIHYNALGRAILTANEPGEVSQLLRESQLHTRKRRSIVLIDEIDKAPRDFPNDLLNEIEGMYFTIPELEGARVSADASLRPIVIITSNSEKNLADAFLRRCVFYDLPFPSREELSRIIHTRLGENVASDRDVLNDALDVFEELRRQGAGLQKTPSTSELLAWLEILCDRTRSDRSHIRSESMIEPALSALIKTAEDRPKATGILEEWLKSKRK